MAMAKPKVAVIGVGGAGSAACRYLARAGADVVGYEQFSVGHTRGSSHGESRIIRYTYPNRLYTSMMADAYPLWSELERDSGEGLFVRCGGIYFGEEGNAEMAAVRDSLDDAGVPYETLDPAQVAARFPAIRLAEREYAFFQPESGFLRASRCVRAHAELARRDGAQIRENTTVAGIESRAGGGVRLRTTDGGTSDLDRAIITAGPWMGEFLASLRLPLQVTRQVIVYLGINEQDWERYAPGPMPVWIDAGTHWYGFPSDGILPGIKLALHAPGLPADPGYAITPADMKAALGDTHQGVAPAETYAAERLPGTREAVSAATCLYTNTPDEDFILDSVPGIPDAYLVSGCSGHGFKFTTLLGFIASGWAMGEPYKRDLSRFGLARFMA